MNVNTEYSGALKSAGDKRDLRDLRSSRVDAGIDKVAKRLGLESEKLKQAFDEARTSSAAVRMGPQGVLKAVAEKVGVEFSDLKNAMETAVKPPPRSRGKRSQASSERMGKVAEKLGVKADDLEKALMDSLQQVEEDPQNQPNFLELVASKLGVSASSLLGAVRSGPQLVDVRV